MEYGFLGRAGKFLQEQKKHRRWMMMFLCLAGGVTLGTLTFLKLYGQAMTHKVKVLECQYEVHEHTDDCYAENEDGAKSLVCGYADYVVHVHNDDCYNTKGELVCTLEEHALHEHTDDCYGRDEILVCTEPESEGTPVPEEPAEPEAPVQSEPEQQEPSAEPVKTVETTTVQICEKEEHTHGDGCYSESQTCGLNEHTHGDGCYSEEQVCGMDEHSHDDSCYDEEGGLVCSEEEHTHDGGCMQTELTCSEAEHAHTGDCLSSELTCSIEEHTHEDACYEQQTIETMSEPEPAESAPAEEPAAEEPVPEVSQEVSEGHTHTDECYEVEEGLICGEQELHIHDDSCYSEDCFDGDGNLIDGSRVSCGLLQLEEHVHSEECFKIVELTPEEVAALNGGAALHVHSEECYDEEGNLICGHEVTHIHGLECYDGEGNLVCGFESEHEHDAGCYDEEGNLTCGYKGSKDHEHDADCYDEEGNLTCGYEGVKDHEHSAGCYNEEGNLICGYEGAKVHEHGAACYDEEGNLICGYEDAKDHEHDTGCYDEEGNLICGYEGAKDHEHDAGCYDMYGELICGYEGAKDHVHTETCYDEEGNLICGYEIKEAYSNSRTFEGGHYTVIAKYNDDANIPEEAELLVEEITPDSDREHYERRELEYQEMMEDNTASMRALLKIGFYIEEDGEMTEIEPETPMLISVQFLDDDGLPEGSPVTVIHFAEDGTEKLDGGSAVDNSTTFRMESFSEIAIGYVEEEPKRELKEAEDGTMRLHLADSFEYKDDAFQISFHVEGEAILPGKTDADTDGTDLSAEETESGTDQDLETKAQTDTQGAEDEADVSETPKEADKAETEEEVKPEDEESSAAEETVENEGAEASGEESDIEDSEESDKEDIKADGTAGENENAVTEVPKLRFKVEQADKNSEEYKALTAYAEEADGAELLYRINVMTYSLTYGGEELDLSRCKVTAEIRPAPRLQEEMEKSVSDAAAYLLGSDGTIIQSESETVPETAPYMAEDETEPSEEELPSDSEEQKPEDASDTEGAEDIMTDSEPEGENGLEEEQSGESEPSADASERMETNGVDDLAFVVRTVAEDGPMDLARMDFNGSEEEPLEVDLSGVQVFATQASGYPNPEFTVQYYANLEKVAYDEPALKEVSSDGKNTNELPVIDTDGGKLPANGKGKDASPNGNAIRMLYVDTRTGRLKTKTELTEIYAERSYKYHKAPTINYINAVIESPSYELKQVWILKEGKDAASINESDWTRYPYNEHLHFTNRALSEGVEDGETYIYIKDGATIRLVYDTTSKDKDLEVAFYDYDIGDGKIYETKEKAQSGKDGKPTSTQGTGIWYMRTGQQGINSAGNYTGSGAKLAFGNSNSGSGLQHEKWEGNLLNKNNSTQGGHPTVNGSYKGCTFRLASSLRDGKIQYADGVIAPNLFNDGAATGKTAYDNGEYSLTFNRVGDTHTLTAVNGAGTSNLDTFNNPSPYAGKIHYHIWTNNFWPMDSAGSYGSNGHDMKFGDYVRRTNHKFAGQVGSDGSGAIATGDFPWSDDGQDHNSYFGMHYKVEFDLVADYVGPLEYYFFGDDDMWVFLGDGDGNGELVCDIGGVHSSVGEYLDLWDYIDKEKEKIHRHEESCYGNGENEEPTCGYVDSKKFTLNFFYTERGESGSTCWMQFTLPSVSSLTPETTEDDFGHLEIRKSVEVTANGKDYYPAEGFFGEKTEQNKFFEEKEFTFTLALKGLKDDYAYVKYDKDGNVITDQGGVLAWDTVASGEQITLKDGEYIRIQYLPVGAQYTITESDTEIQGVVYDRTDITADDKNGETTDIENSLEISGDIPQRDTSEVYYTNKYSAYALPETGGPGLILYTAAGALIFVFGAGFMYRRKLRERRV